MNKWQIYSKIRVRENQRGVKSEGERNLRGAEIKGEKLKGVPILM